MRLSTTSSTIWSRKNWLFDTSVEAKKALLTNLSIADLEDYFATLNGAGDDPHYIATGRLLQFMETLWSDKTTKGKGMGKREPSHGYRPDYIHEDDWPPSDHSSQKDDSETTEVDGKFQRSKI